MKLISIESLTKLLNHHGFNEFLVDLIEELKKDFVRWDKFTIIPRPAMHVPGGVLELMPVCDNEEYYSFKYVNCHPKNPNKGKMTVVATGQLSRIDTGYPLMFSEMTILTALRTAATSALATDLMSRKNSHTVSIIGTGAQSEFQLKGLLLVREINEVRYFDIDSSAMDKFEKNMAGDKFILTRCNNVKEAVYGSDIITVCTASKVHADLIKNEWISQGVHINALGGDTIGKTELELKILPRCRIVVEYFDQTFIEGEIQRLTKREAKKLATGELYKLVKGMKVRKNDKEITLFDSVGIALEDYSVLRLVYKLSERYKIGEDLNFIPNISDPKNLYSMLY